MRKILGYLLDGPEASRLLLQNLQMRKANPAISAKSVAKASVSPRERALRAASNVIRNPTAPAAANAVAAQNASLLPFLSGRTSRFLPCLGRLPLPAALPHPPLS